MSESKMVTPERNFKSIFQAKKDLLTSPLLPSKNYILEKRKSSFLSALREPKKSHSYTKSIIKNYQYREKLSTI